MARIRTIKPEFFTSEDIVEIEPMARLLYVALWCEADKEGRFSWKPKTFKMRYLPADECDIDALCDALVTRGLVVLYGNGLAYIPTFKDHQHINPREKDSGFPPPDAENTTRSSRVSDASVTHREEGREGKEGKGREGEGRVNDADAAEAAKTTGPKKGHRLPDDWQLPKGWGQWALTEYPAWTAEIVRLEAAKFADHWHAKAGKDASKTDWEATWRNWCRSPICQETHTGKPTFAQHAADVARTTVPSRVERDPVLLEIERHSAHAAPIPQAIREKIAALKGVTATTEARTS